MNDGFEHSVVQDTGGIDTDKVEKSTTHKVKDNGGNSDTSIDASPLSFSKVAYGFNLLPTRFKNFYIYDSTIGPEGLLNSIIMMMIYYYYYYYHHHHHHY